MSYLKKSHLMEKIIHRIFKKMFGFLILFWKTETRIGFWFIFTWWIQYVITLDVVSSKVSVLGVVALGGHFATLFQELDFYEAFFFIINFQKEMANTLTLLIIC